MHAENQPSIKKRNRLQRNEIKGVFGHKSALQGPGTYIANEITLGMKHAPGAGSIARPIDLCYSYPVSG